MFETASTNSALAEHKVILHSFGSRLDELLPTTAGPLELTHQVVDVVEFGLQMERSEVFMTEVKGDGMRRARCTFKTAPARVLDLALTNGTAVVRT